MPKPAAACADGCFLVSRRAWPRRWQAYQTILSVIGRSTRAGLAVLGKRHPLRLHPSPVGAQRFQQRWAKGHIAVAPALALADMDHHALAVDIAGLELAQLRAAYAGRIERHQHRAMHPVGRSGQ